MDLEKAFDIVPRKVLEWAIRKKGIPEVFVRSVMSLYDGAKTRFRVDSELSEEFEVKVGMHQGSVLSHFPSAVVVDVVTELAREGALSELLYTDDLVLSSETIVGLRNKFLKWKEDLRARDWKVTYVTPKWWSMAAPQGMACLKPMLTHVGSMAWEYSVQWIHGRCAGVKSVSAKF